MRKTVWETVSSVALTIAACVIAATLVVREFRPARASTKPSAPVNLADSTWRRIMSSGRVLGQATAPVKLAVFSDFECPFCARFHARWKDVEARHRDTIALVFLHYPLEQHKFARPAVVAAECASEAARFEQYGDVVFASQDSIGLISWADLAVRAGIADTAAFNRCVSAAKLPPMLGVIKGLASELRVAGTPTVVLDGVKYLEPPSDAEIRAAIDRSRKGQKRP